MAKEAKMGVAEPTSQPVSEPVKEATTINLILDVPLPPDIEDLPDKKSFQAYEKDFKAGVDKNHSYWNCLRCIRLQYAKKGLLHEDAVQQALNFLNNRGIKL
jgi:hypothetical protein